MTARDGLFTNLKLHQAVLAGVKIEPIAAAVLGEAGLSFLGVGTPPAIPSWGQMLGDARNFLAQAPWTMAAPGAALMVTVLGLNLLGDGIRDVLDPRLRRQA